MKINVTYTGIWDNNNKVSSNARLDLDTGKIVDIETVDMDGLCVLDNENISLQLGDMTAVFEVVEDGDGDYAVDPNDLKQIKTTFSSKFIENKWQAAKAFYNKSLLEYKYFKRRELLDRILKAFEKEIKKTQNEDLISLYKDIKTFNPIEVYPQRDIFLYDGYRIWCESFIFVQEDSNGIKTEKAIIFNKDADFDNDSISIINKEQDKFFKAFANLEVEGLEDYLEFLRNIHFNQDIVEEEETIK